MLQIETVAVVGTSEAGTTCAVLAALAGCAVRVFDPSDAALLRAFEVIRRRVELAFAEGAVTRAERQRILDGVLLTPDLDEALAGAELAVDAAATSIEDLHAHLAAALPATAAVAAAHGAEEALASRLPQPGRVLALHLADAQGPVPRMEFLPAAATSAQVLESARDLAARVNRAWRTPRPPERAGGRPTPRPAVPAPRPGAGKSPA